MSIVYVSQHWMSWETFRITLVSCESQHHHEWLCSLCLHNISESLNSMALKLGLCNLWCMPPKYEGHRGLLHIKSKKVQTCVCVCVRERERERERESERERHTHRDRQTETERDRDRDRILDTWNYGDSELNDKVTRCHYAKKLTFISASFLKFSPKCFQTWIPVCEQWQHLGQIYFW